MFTIFIESLAGGMLAVFGTARQEQVAWRFVRLVGVLVFALAALAIAWEARAHGLPVQNTEIAAAVCSAALALNAAAVVLAAPLSWRLTAAFRVLCIMGGVAGIAAGLCLSLTRYSEVLRSPTADGLLIVSHLLGSILLGSVTVAWLLGHAYLTATKMTIAPLMHFSRVLSWAVAARAAFLVLSLGAAWLVGAEGGQAVSAVIYNSWLVTSLRILMGIVVLGVFAYMVAGCVRIRSTQSATGILYFGSVFAYIGELAGLQLIQECGWPL